MKQIKFPIKFIAACILVVNFSEYAPAAQPALSSAITERDQSDLAARARMRRALVMDTDLSNYAVNVQIKTDPNGVIVLSGPVRSEYERDRVYLLAMQATAKRVENKLFVVREEDARIRSAKLSTSY